MTTLQLILIGLNLLLLMSAVNRMLSGNDRNIWLGFCLAILAGLLAVAQGLYYVFH